ncbi:hypothetical protein VIN01S_07640 [Vibrio inusitatus NBRC 102082]|uniref:Cyd operon protein YbgT n=1 Tax=Vibrio inusitatus NBRC 102082 TaxID=1219070 RepID=A0A4Y3HT89_9VIBR|nr:hypothetical protein VIN01S_07640 [Vibrio inusitatus NBRC 102082]
MTSSSKKIRIHFTKKGQDMWYFAWILGVLLACAFGIINALWLEHTEMMDEDKQD